MDGFQAVKIVKIETFEEEIEMVDIEVDKDHLFLVNGVLTHNSTDVDMEDTAESFGLPATCDYMFALTRTDELISLNQMLVKQLKNRYGDKNRYRRFVIGVDQAKMRYYDLQESAQTITDDGPINNDRKQKKNVGKKMRQLADFKDFT